MRILINCMKCEFNLLIHDEVIIKTANKNGVFRNPLM